MPLRGRRRMPRADADVACAFDEARCRCFEARTRRLRFTMMRDAGAMLLMP